MTKTSVSITGNSGRHDNVVRGCSKRRESIMVSVMLGVLVVTAGVVVWIVARDKQPLTPAPPEPASSRRTGNAILSHDLTFEAWNNSVLKFRGFMSWEGVANTSAVDCSSTAHSDICLEWPDRRLVINHTQSRVHGLDCHDVELSAKQCEKQVLTHCFQWSGAHWFGGYQDKYQHWPLDPTNRTLTAYVATDSYAGEIGGVLEPYFFNTNGTSFYIDNDVPLYLSLNNPEGVMCLVAKYEPYPYLNVHRKFPALKYKICQAANVKEVHQKTSEMFIAKPVTIPDESLFRFPIWSTWAQYHKDINQSSVLDFAQSILQNNFTHAQLEIDDDWTPAYGDMVFNTEKFPDARQMVSDLTEQGFRVTVWVHPFFNIDSESFFEAGRNYFLLRNYDSPQPALTSWWDGQLAGILDVSNDSAVKWYLGKLEKLRKDYNISSFKFDAGEIKWLPNIYSAAESPNNPNDLYPRQWAYLAARADETVRHQEVRVGYQTQSLPVFVRMMDKFSTWDHDNGLKALIPSALTFGILGYPFVLPDMIGGNAYTKLPEAELFIRWMQVNTFLPSLQFSIVPWQFNESIIEITRKFTNLHKAYSDLFIDLARESVRTGAPIIRPLWWIAPDDREAWISETEFLVGDDLLVAPVVEPGQRQRDIYLPAGSWTDKLRGGTLTGGRWYANYSVDIDELPYFTRLN